MFSQNEYENETFKDIDLQNEELSGVEFDECAFIKCNFSSTLFKGCTFKNCEFEHCDLSLAKVDGSIFKGVKFTNSKVIGINWTAASWGQKELHQLLKSIDFFKCIMNYSSFFGLELEKIQIEECIAHEVDFSEANLNGTNFKGSDLEKSVFRNTSLENANFIGAENYYIPPGLNKLKKARFSMPEAMSLLYSMDIIIDDLPQDDN